MTLTAEEFIRRFLLHVLPPGLQRIRYYGFLGNRYRQEKLEQCRRLLQMSPPTQEKTDPDVSSDYRDRCEALTGVSLRVCPACGRGRMITVEQVSPSKAQDPPRVLDTS